MIHSYPVTAAAAALLASATTPETKSGDPLDLLAKKFGDHVSEVLTKLGATNEQLSGVKEQIAEMEQKAARGYGSGHSRSETLGETFTKGRADDLLRISSERGRTSMEIKAPITSATTDANGSAGALAPTQRDTLLSMPRRRLTIRNLLNVVQVTSGSVEYPRQTGRVNNAGMVAEAAAKPQSDLKFDMKTTPIRTIAHWVKASKQILEDAPQLRDLIDGELRYGLSLVEENQLLNGDGTGQNLNGMIPQATAFDPNVIFVPGSNEIDKVGMAILQASLTDIPPDGIVLHPSSWWKMRLTKNGDGEYVLGKPGDIVPPSLFGLPVVPTEAMNTDRFLVGAFSAQTL